MRYTRVLLIGATALALYGCGLYGCGGGSGSSSSTPDNNPLASGRAALNKLASGDQPTNQQTLQSIQTLFLQAVQSDPNSLEAHFGAAVCLIGMTAEQVDNFTDSEPTLGAGASGGGNASGGAPPSLLPPTPPPTSAPSNSRVETPPAPPLPSTAASSTISAGGEVPPAPPALPVPVKPLPPHHTLGLVWNLSSDLSSPYTLLHMLGPVTDLRFGLLPYSGYQNDAAPRRQQMLANLQNAVQHLEKVEADPHFTLTLAAPHQPGQTVSVGLPEVYLFDAYARSLIVEISLSLAYIREVGNDYPPAPPEFSGGTKPASSRNAGRPRAVGWSVSAPSSTPLPPNLLDRNHDGKLTPDEYLPASPFLTLRDPALLSTAQQALAAVADKAAKGLDGALARPAGGNFLIPGTSDVRQTLTQIRDNVLPLIRQAATGPVTLQVPRLQPMPLLPSKTDIAIEDSAPGGTGNVVFSARPTLGDNGSLPPAPPITLLTESVTINLAAWFAHPPTDLKAFAPTYPVGADGWPLLDQATYPDPTFGGLFPNGLPKDLLF